MSSHFESLGEQKQSMHVVTQVEQLERGRPTVLTIGAFDGVHRGHQYLIRQVINRARSIDAASMVLTFDPRPQVILRPDELQLTDGVAKERIISALGVDTLVIMPFSQETTQIPAGQFLVSILDHVNLTEIWLGADFAFGHKRGGNVDFLIRAGQHSGFAVHVVARQALGRRCSQQHTRARTCHRGKGSGSGVTPRTLSIVAWTGSAGRRSWQGPGFPHRQHRTRAISTRARNGSVCRIPSHRQ